VSEPTTKPAWVEPAQVALALVGLGLLSYGAGLAYRPAGFIVPGLVFLAAAIVGAIRG
jgi:hypothetical protein